jgi:DNA invertase Pin-like site-specific DNA recombinase
MTSNIKMKCVIYARVSTDKQAQKELSIPAQIQAMKDFAQRNDWKIVGHFVDRGESARTANRPELKRLIQYCREERNVDVVLVHKIDRLARRVKDHIAIWTELEQKGIQFVSMSEPIEKTSGGKLMRNMFACLSEYYSDNLGDEIRKSNLAKLQKGEWPHMPPVGYKSVSGINTRVEHVPHESTAPLIRQAFELFATGNYSLKTLSEEMYHRGLTTRHGKMHSEENTKRILSRDFYIGQLTWQGKVYPGKHQPIVPKNVFYRVQEVLKNRSVDTGEKGRLEFLLRGVAYCQVCKRRLTGEIHPRGSYYRCLHDLHHARCSERYIPVKSLDDQLVALYKRLQPPRTFIEALKTEIHELVKRRTRLAERQLGILRRTIAEIEQKEYRLLDGMLAGVVPRDTYEKMEKVYRQKRVQAEARLSQLEVNYDDPLAFLDKCSVVAESLTNLHHHLDFENRKSLLQAVFQRIDVQDGEIVGAQLTPPFLFFCEDAIRDLFKHPPVAGTKRDGFEQIVLFTISDEYAQANERIKRVMTNAGQHCGSIGQAA